jgi:hypothetical protein
VQTTIRVFLLTAFALLGFPTTSDAAPATTESIVVTAVQGDVRVTLGGESRAAKPGMVVRPPATIRTRDGTLELRQGGTRVSIARDSEIAIPAAGVRGKPVDRIVQPRGNAFYDVAPRSGSKLRVETPYLVAVIKGTQFNVAANEESATVSLFEGRLEIWTPDESDVVQLNAGEIATRSRTDRAIRVLLMSSGETLRAQNAAPMERADTRSASTADVTAPGFSTHDPVRLVEPAGLSPQSSPLDRTPGGIVGSPAPALSAELPKLEIGAGSLPVLNVEASLDLGAGNVSTGTAEVSVETSLAGAIDAGVGTAVAVDLGSGSLDAGVTADIGVAGVDAVDATVTAGIDTSAGAIDVGVAVGPLDVDLGVDLTPSEPPPATQPNVVDELVKPLRGLLGR